MIDWLVGTTGLPHWIRQLVGLTISHAQPGKQGVGRATPEIAILTLAVFSRFRPAIEWLAKCEVQENYFP